LPALSVTVIFEQFIKIGIRACSKIFEKLEGYSNVRAGNGLNASLNTSPFTKHHLGHDVREVERSI